MKIATPHQMKNIDLRTVSLGVPSILLMENAASAVVAELPCNASSFLVVCGSGNNGGDGYAIARLLYCADKKVSILKCGEPKTEDAVINYNIAVKLGIAFVTLETLTEYDVIVDALLGTGLNGSVRENEQSIIEYINNADSYVCSVDMPSGTDGKSGLTCGVSVKADKTVTFALVKQGQLWSDNIGKLVLKGISIPHVAVKEEDIKVSTIDCSYVKSLLPVRSTDAHKGSCGKILAVAGSEGMTGAARLCCEAVLRTGAGLLRLAIPKSLNIIMEKCLVEAMTIPVNDCDGAVSAEAAKEIIPYIDKSDVLLIGCGLSTNFETKQCFESILSACDVPMVIDADGLNILADNLSLIKNKNVVITPHLVEFARLSGLTTDEILQDRVKAASDFAVQYGVVTVLKGKGTVIALPDGEAYINNTGNEGMATGGSGDVLAGIIASLIGQGLSVTDGAVAGVFIHGVCGDIAKEYKGIHSMLPSDMINCIGEAIDTIKEID